MGRCPLAAVHVLAALGKRPVGRGAGRKTGPVQCLRKERKEQEQRRGVGAAVPGLSWEGAAGRLGLRRGSGSTDVFTR